LLLFFYFVCDFVLSTFQLSLEEERSSRLEKKVKQSSLGSVEDVAQLAEGGLLPSLPFICMIEKAVCIMATSN